MKVVDPDGVIVGFVNDSGKGGSTPWSATCFRGLRDRAFRCDYGNPTEAGSNVIAVHRGWLKRTAEHATALAKYQETDGEMPDVARRRTRRDDESSVKQDSSTSVPADRRVKIDRELKELLAETPKEEQLPGKTTTELADELSLNGTDHEEVRVETLAAELHTAVPAAPTAGSTAEDLSRAVQLAKSQRQDALDAAALAGVIAGPGEDHFPPELLRILEENTDRESVPGCWIWTGTGSGRDKPVVRHKGQRYTPRQVWYEVEHGSPPDGRLAMTCGNPLCGAPDHAINVMQGTPRVPTKQRAEPVKEQETKHGETFPEILRAKIETITREIGIRTAIADEASNLAVEARKRAAKLTGTLETMNTLLAQVEDSDDDA